MACIFKDCVKKPFLVRKGMVQGHPDYSVTLCSAHSQCEVTFCERPLAIIKQIDTGEWVFMCMDHHMIHEQTLIQEIPPNIRGPCAVVNCSNRAVVPCGPSFVCIGHNYCRAYPCKEIIPITAKYCIHHIHKAWGHKVIRNLRTKFNQSEQ